MQYDNIVGNLYNYLCNSNNEFDHKESDIIYAVV